MSKEADSLPASRTAFFSALVSFFGSSQDFLGAGVESNASANSDLRFRLGLESWSRVSAEDMALGKGMLRARVAQLYSVALDKVRKAERSITFPRLDTHGQFEFLLKRRELQKNHEIALAVHGLAFYSVSYLPPNIDQLDIPESCPGTSLPARSKEVFLEA